MPHPEATGAPVVAPAANVSRRETMRVLIADVGAQAAWLPGDRQTIRLPTPSQAAALRGAALEALVTDGDAPPLLAMLPTVAAGPAEPLEAGTTAWSRVAALCAVRDVRTTGKRTGGVQLDIKSATLEVVGRVAVKSLEMLAGADDAGLVAAVEGSAVLEDAWVDELGLAPVHAVKRYRPLADLCCRTHAKIRERLRGTDLVTLAADCPLVDHPLADEAAAAVSASSESLAAAAAAALAAASECDFGAYGDVVETDPEVDELRAISFAAWRALRPPLGAAAPEDVVWAFVTRSTEDRLQRASDMLLEWLEELELVDEARRRLAELEAAADGDATKETFEELIARHTASLREDMSND